MTLAGYIKNSSGSPERRLLGSYALRGALIGTSAFSGTVDLAAMTAFAVIMVVLGAYFFEKSESV